MLKRPCVVGEKERTAKKEKIHHAANYMISHPVGRVDAPHLLTKGKTRPIKVGIIMSFELAY